MKIQCPHCAGEHDGPVEMCPVTGKKLGAATWVLGRTLGKYRVVKLVAEGGMGAVFEAVHETLGRRVALKFLHPWFVNDDELLKRFRREAKAAAKIGHENIVDIIDIERDEGSGSAYIVMELLEGKTLDRRIAASGGLPPKEAVDIMLQILSALHASHTLGIIHRDLKPENVFLADRPGGRVQVKILDFGMAKIKQSETASVLTGKGTLLGTPHYMAPELLETAGAALDNRVDLYACGIILYESLAGKPPFDAKNLTGIYYAILHDTPRDVRMHRPDIPDDLAELVMKAFARAPAERFASAVEMALAVEPFGSGRLPVKASIGKVEELTRTARARVRFADETTEKSAPKIPRPPEKIVVIDPAGQKKRRIVMAVIVLLLFAMAIAAGMIFF